MNQADLMTSDPVSDLLHQRERLLAKLSALDERLETVRPVEVPPWASSLLTALARAGVSGWFDGGAGRVILGGVGQTGTGYVSLHRDRRSGAAVQVSLGARATRGWKRAVLRAVLESDVLS